MTGRESGIMLKIDDGREKTSQREEGEGRLEQKTDCRKRESKTRETYREIESVEFRYDILVFERSIYLGSFSKDPLTLSLSGEHLS